MECFEDLLLGDLRKKLTLWCFLLGFGPSIALCQEPADSTIFTIYAHNLSEDKNILPIKNDEIIFQLYAASESGVLDEPILYELMLFDEENRTSELAISKNEFSPQHHYYLFLTEYEYDKSYEQRSPIYRVYYNQLLQAYDSTDLVKVSRFLGSDDLLGASKLSYEELVGPLTLEYMGVQNFEKYGYQIILNQE